MNPRIEPTNEAELYAMGFSIKQVAEIKFCSFSTTRRILLRQGVQLRQAGGMRRKPSHEDLRRTEYLYVDLQWSTNEIARMEGLSSSTVTNRLRLAGVSMRTGADSYRLKRVRKTGPERIAA